MTDVRLGELGTMLRQDAANTRGKKPFTELYEAGRANALDKSAELIESAISRLRMEVEAWPCRAIQQSNHWDYANHGDNCERCRILREIEL